MKQRYFKIVVLLLTACMGANMFICCSKDDEEYLNVDSDTREYVDLGLPSGTLWATCNIGAISPEKSGNYFAWGETKPKKTYSWDTYRYCKHGGDCIITKYCPQGYAEHNGFADDKRDLEPEDDAATANWGREWQMPSPSQLYELVDNNNTTTTWTTLNGVYGRRITSKTNGNSIFLPAAGNYTEDGISQAGSAGYYWSRKAYRRWNGESMSLYFSSEYVITYGDYGYNQRYNGRSVRPVRVLETNYEWPESYKAIDDGYQILK